MKSRWIAAVAAAGAIALLTVPMLLSGDGRTTTASVTTAEVPPNATCKGEGLANFDFTLKDPSGGTLRLADYKGKVLLLNFWGTWCGPCRREIPALIQVQEAYRDKGFIIVGVAFEDTAEAVRAYSAEMKINYPLAMAQDDFDNAYGPVYGLPLSMFVARDGSICKKHFGELTKERVEHEIKSLL
jgi:thiol-disulfide isomerase/thioredoxin